MHCLVEHAKHIGKHALLLVGEYLMFSEHA